MKTIRILIIEDEAATARNLAYLLQNADDRIRIATMTESVQETLEWLSEHPYSYDLIFSDIRLADGLSFEVFKKIKVNTPVVFVTAYDNHAIEAFKNNGIDYILKPFDEEELQAALAKFESLTAQGNATPAYPDISALLELMQKPEKTFRKSFLIAYRDKLIPVESRQIAWFYTANEQVYAHTLDARQYIIEETLEELEKQLDPGVFFRANRQYIINRKAISEIEHHFNGRLFVKISPATPENVLVSKARATVFKNWLNG